MPKTTEPLPYFKWLWRDWRANRKVQRLHYVARGLYRELLDEQWSEGSVPSDLQALADICGCPVEVMEEHWPALQEFFEEADDGNLVNLKLEKQRTDEDAVRIARSKSGKQGALAKLKKTKEDQANAKQLPEVARICHIAEQSRAEQSISISEHDVDENDNGQDETMKIKNEIQAVCFKYSVKPGGWPDNWNDLAMLGRIHSVGAVVRDFEDWMQENLGDDFPSGPVAKYLRVAHDRLSCDATAPSCSPRDPEVVSLARAIQSASGGEITLLDKQKVRLMDALKEFSQEEILAGFRNWWEKQDLTKDNPGMLAGKYSQIAGDLAFGVREARTKRENEQAARDAAARRLQEEAEAERRAKPVEPDFDPLADISGSENSD